MRFLSRFAPGENDEYRRRPAPRASGHDITEQGNLGQSFYFSDRPPAAKIRVDPAAGHVFRSENDEEKVPVNLRELIDKGLARSPGEFAVFRELLQSFDESSATSVEIHFRTQVYIENKMLQVQRLQPLPDLKTMAIHEYVFRSSEQTFCDELWKRFGRIGLRVVFMQAGIVLNPMPRDPEGLCLLTLFDYHRASLIVWLAVADGSPDEENVCAALYSTFSNCEGIMVQVGAQWMRICFEDKTDRLFVRRGAVATLADPATLSTQRTEFKMFIRQPSLVPNANDLTKFLLSSLAFTRTLSQVSIWLDGVRLSVIDKSTGDERSWGLPKGLRPKSSNGVMTVTKVTSRALFINVQVLRWVYAANSENFRLDEVPTPQDSMSFCSNVSSQPNSPQLIVQGTPGPPEPIQMTSWNEEELLKEVKSSIVLEAYSAHASVRLDANLALELQRSTGKHAFAQVRVDLIYTGKDEYDMSVAGEEKQHLSASIFRGLRADLDGSDTTKIFIDKIFNQTTGMGGHLSAHFIPTVEHESIDFQDRNVAIWNRGLLYIGGYLARAVYELEMARIRELWRGISDCNGEVKSRYWLQQRATHSLRFFTFHPSHPSTEISKLLERSFFDCAEQKLFPILSSIGIRDAGLVRMPHVDFSFLETLAVVHPDAYSGAPRTIDSLRRRGFLPEVTLKDVLDELRVSPLSEEQMGKCLRWLSQVNTDSMNGRNSTLHLEFLNACSFVPKDAPQGMASKLSTVRTFVSSDGASRVISDGPLPNHTLPFGISRLLPTEALQKLFGWTELGLVEWLLHIVAPEKPHAAAFDITHSAVWAEHVLDCLARGLPSLSQADHDDVLARLSSVSCIPTNAGMVPPDKAYLLSVAPFHDLPIVTLSRSRAGLGGLEKLLELMGVRRHVDLQLLFAHMVGDSEPNTYQVIKYLCSVQNTLSEGERNMLKTTDAFAKEDSEAKKKLVVGQRPVMFALKDLYEPLETFRAMNLPLLQIHGWQSNSDEAQFLTQVGLRRFPSLRTLLQIASGASAKAAATALNYLLDNVGPGEPYARYHRKHYRNFKFIPSVKPGGTKSMESPLEVYADANCAIMGFTVLDTTLGLKAKKLPIDECPSAVTLIGVLSSAPPTDHSTAREWFEFLSSRSGDFRRSDFNNLRSIKFIPVPSKPQDTGKEEMILMAPEEVYFADGANATKRLHLSELFVFIDFGRRAKIFLKSCGVSEEPSPDNIARRVAADPKHFLKLSGGYEGFLEILRFIASNERNIAPETIQQFRASPVLVATKVRSSHEQLIPEEQQDDSIESLYEETSGYHLVIASNAVINDDQLAASVFAGHIFCAPQEQMLESFYASLGSPNLSSLVREDFHTGAEVKNAAAAAQAKRMRCLIRERLPLFFSDMHSTSLAFSWVWLRKRKNFHISIVQKVSRVLTLTQGNAQRVEQQVVSASARHKASTNLSTRRRPLVLSLSYSTRLNMSDVAVGLCRLILKQPRAQDIVLLLTSLTTDPRLLRERNYHVYRLLQRQSERRASEDSCQSGTTRRGYESPVSRSRRSSICLSPCQIASREIPL